MHDPSQHQLHEHHNDSCPDAHPPHCEDALDRREVEGPLGKGVGGGQVAAALEVGVVLNPVVPEPAGVKLEESGESGAIT